MKNLLFIAVVVGGLISPVVAQKKSTLLGDMVIGEVTARNEATREITITYPGKEGAEVFSGFLIDGYMLRVDKVVRRELMMNEITPGIRVRVFYKSDNENVGGQKKKIYRIVRFEFLGKDEFVRLRDQLNVPSSTVVAQADNDDLPSTAPLKVYISAAYVQAQRDLVEWATKWNRKHTDPGEQVELVSELDQADVLMIVARGSDTQVVAMPMDYYAGDQHIKGHWTQATLYLVRRDPDELKVLWSGIALVFSTQNTDSVSP